MATLTHIEFHSYLEVHAGNPERYKQGAPDLDANRTWDKHCLSLARPYHVNFWGSHPDAGNDDCWSGQSFATLDEAIAYYEKEHDCSDFVELVLGGDASDLYRTGRNPVRLALSEGEADTDEEDGWEDEWRREQAMEAGMLHGTQAYNEVMGY